MDLWNGLDRQAIEPGQIGASSPPMVVGDVVIVGAALQGGTAPKSKNNVPGYVRGYDIRSGGLLWTFHTEFLSTANSAMTPGTGIRGSTPETRRSGLQ